MKERKARTTAKLKTRIVCKQCCVVFKNTSKKISIKCPSCDKTIDARDRTGWYKDWCKRNQKKAEERKKSMIEYNKKTYIERGKKTRERLRKSVLNIISNNNPKCEWCGCDDMRLLEINHINGGGKKEIDKTGSWNFIWDIYKGRRKTNDLNLLCRVCNAHHYLELKYGELPFSIEWNDKKN